MMPGTGDRLRVAVLLRPGKTPSGIEIRGHLRRLVRRIQKHWPATRITIRLQLAKGFALDIPRLSARTG
jgi:hypothetical protein